MVNRYTKIHYISHDFTRRDIAGISHFRVIDFNYPMFVSGEGYVRTVHERNWMRYKVI